VSILVVGSVALDNVETPAGKVEDYLGGAATYFSTIASLYARVHLVAVVGEDFPRRHVDFLASRNVDLRGLQIVPGRTFRWTGRYEQDLNVAHTLATELNVFADFRPLLPEGYGDCDYVFLANIDPELQLRVVEQVRAPKLIALDTMNYWIESKPAALTEVLKRVDIVLVNESEARLYAGKSNLIRASRAILELGPKALVVKKGEYGATLYCPGDSLEQSCFYAPAYPLEQVVDPTGAGDTFAGGFMGYLAQAGEFTPQAIRQAIVHGSVAASFAVEGFGLDRLRTVTLEDILRRYQVFRSLTSFA